MEIPSQAHELFALDPNDFVAARDQLAKDLRARGDKDAAKAVKGLRRPAVPIWALNQVARRRPDEIEQLVAASVRAQAAKDADVRDALSHRRDALHSVVVAARQIIEESGRSADPHELDLTSALSTILASGALTKDLRDGTLTRVTDDAAEIEWPDVSGTPPLREQSRAPSRALVRAREELERRRTAVDDAVSRAAEAERLLAAAQDAMTKAEQEVARLEA